MTEIPRRLLLAFSRLGCTVNSVDADRSPRTFRMEWRGSGLPSFCANAMPVEFMSLVSNLFDFNEVVEMIYLS